MAASDRRTREVERAVVDATEAWLLRGREGEVFSAVVVDAEDGRGTVVLDGLAIRGRCTGEGLRPGTRVRVRLEQADVTAPDGALRAGGSMTRAPHLAARLQGFGTTVFAEMSALAVATGSVNLGQGFPDYPGPPEVLDVARAAIGTPADQYPPGPGRPELRAGDRRARPPVPRGRSSTPTPRCSSPPARPRRCPATLLALLETGDEVVLFEPMYDCYAAGIAMAGGVARPVPLLPPEDGAGPWTFDPADLRTAITPRTKLLLLNSPHNPTGKVFTRDELALLAELAIAHDLLVLTDEVYEHLVFDGAEHVSLATLPGMRERTLVVSSAGKTFNVTGWKIGWISGPAALVAAVRTAKQFLTYVNGGPFQPAVAAGLALPDEYFDRRGAGPAVPPRRPGPRAWPTAACR